MGLQQGCGQINQKILAVEMVLEMMLLFFNNSDSF
jgi:hypothetical protein